MFVFLSEQETFLLPQEAEVVLNWRAMLSQAKPGDWYSLQLKHLYKADSVGEIIVRGEGSEAVQVRQRSVSRFT